MVSFTLLDGTTPVLLKVYRVTPQKTPDGKISVTQFAHTLGSLSTEIGQEKPLVLFSGDLFSPSVESTVTRGSHMVPVVNAFGLDVALTGNHDFDFGFPHLTKLVKDCKFPWLLSNICDTETGHVPETLKEFEVLERFGLKIGIIGLVENITYNDHSRDWIETVSSWPQNFKWKDMVETGISLSKRLRNVNGHWACDLVIALTHSRIPNDIALAKALFARPSSAGNVGSSHGVDLILGGHDHLYYVSKGCQSWEGYDVPSSVPLGTEDDDGVLVVKSGTDFRELSELILELEDGEPDSVRKKLVKTVSGKRHAITPQTQSSKEMENVLENLLSKVSSKLGSPLCHTRTALDVRSHLVRTEESAAGNWFADVLRHAYDDALCMQGLGGADGVFICAGTLRGDSIYGPGVVTLGDILEILPFEDPIVVLEVDGASIWEALESSLRTWPAQEGRFPVLSAFCVTWDSRKPPGDRVISISIESKAFPNQREEVTREADKKYKIVTREYMAQGHDGFEALKGGAYLIDEEHGTLMSALVRKYLLGAQYIRTMHNLPTSQPSEGHLHHETSGVLSRARARWQYAQKMISSRRHAAGLNKDAYSVSGREHMQVVDCVDGTNIRGGGGSLGEQTSEGDLVEIAPEVDGRLKDIGREST